METGSLMEWLIPAGFFAACGWAIWHLPAYILSFAPHEDKSVFDRVEALHKAKDVTPDMAPILTNYMDMFDWTALIAIPVLFIIGVRGVRTYSMELAPNTAPGMAAYCKRAVIAFVAMFALLMLMTLIVVSNSETIGWGSTLNQTWIISLAVGSLVIAAADRVAIFIGRVTMVMIIIMTGVMLYEVFLRYALERPTEWANELTLWIGGFVFLCSGFYAMQQRSHIRIFLLYDAVPRNVQRLFDVISAFLICVFAAGLIFGSYKQVFIIKFYKWEMFGTAFDPPIPATIQPMVLIIIAVVAIQAVLNVINDWNVEPEVHTAASDIDQEELEALKKSVGS